MMDEIFAILIAGTVVLAIILGALYVETRWTCSNYHTATELQTKVTGMTCYANVKGQWFPIDKIVSTPTSN